MNHISSVYPYEILYAICGAIYSASEAPVEPSLDPPFPVDNIPNAPPPTGHPSTLPLGSWSEPITRKTLANLCVVNKAWNSAARPWLWRKIEVRMPSSWLSVLDEVVGPEDAPTDTTKAEEVINSGDLQQPGTMPFAALGLSNDYFESVGISAVKTVRFSLDGLLPSGSIPIELLTPPSSRNPSPNRLRAKSPGRWRLMRDVNNALTNLHPDLYHPGVHDTSPGRLIRHLDFNHFRTIGMRRSVGEGVARRFVTGDRVERLLKELPNLKTFGATEYMDGAITLPVLVELLTRGMPTQEKQDTECRGRGYTSGRFADVSVGTDHDSEEPDIEEDTERRSEFRMLEALDLCGCVSVVFVNALNEFVRTYLSAQPDDVPAIFPGLKRLGLRGVTSIPADVLKPFVLAFPSLTHLDLSGTRCTPDLLDALSQSKSIQLTSLALSRCTRLTGASIASFLINAPGARNIEQLSLYGDATFRTPLSPEDIEAIFTTAPCFLSGRLRYLDMSSSPLQPHHLTTMQPQPLLRSLGLSHIPALPLKSIADFLKTRAPNTEIITLVSTSPELGPTVSLRQMSMSLHSQIVRPLATPPFQFSLTTSPTSPLPPPTRLRVIELQTSTLNGLGAGAGAWRIVRSKGGRAWYVDTATAWTNGVLRRDLPTGHPLRVEFERLADCNGNVSSGVGWHARKMEILHGQGMLGREDGLYGAVSFAYSG